jgi:hypothetical protein
MGIQTTSQALINEGVNLGFRNKIINGAMQIWQRGSSFAYNTGGAYFNADRFWVYNNSGASSGNIERSTDVPSNQGFAYSLYNNTNGSHATGTNVELTRQGDYAPFRAGQSYTFSLWVKGTSSGTSNLGICWRNSHATGTNSATVTNTSFPITTTWTRVSVTFVATQNIDSANMVLDFEWVFPVGGKYTGVQLEEGTTVTSFEHRPASLELTLCQRYYQRISGGGNSRHFIAGNGSNTCFPTAYLKQTMRVAPSYSYSSLSHFTIEGLSGGQGTPTFLGINAACADTVTIQAVTGSGINAGGAHLFGSNASAWSGFDSEL